jgi:hypothetical protein
VTFAETKPYAAPEAAMQKLLEIASTVEPVQDGRIYIEKINGPLCSSTVSSRPSTVLA